MVLVSGVLPRALYLLVRLALAPVYGVDLGEAPAAAAAGVEGLIARPDVVGVLAGATTKLLASFQVKVFVNCILYLAAEECLGSWDQIRPGKFASAGFQVRCQLLGSLVRLFAPFVGSYP